MDCWQSLTIFHSLFILAMLRLASQPIIAKVKIDSKKHFQEQSVNIKIPQFCQEKKSLTGLFAGEVSVGTESNFVIQNCAQVHLLAYCLHSYAVDKSGCKDRRVSAKVDKHLFCLRDTEFHVWVITQFDEKSWGYDPPHGPADNHQIIGNIDYEP